MLKFEIPGTRKAVFDYIAAFVFALCIAALIIVLAGQNFVVSTHFDLLPLREVDDFAFQVNLRVMHDALSEGHIIQFIANNNYGYGAIFWALHALISLPGYFAGSDQWIIVAPRMMELAFGIGSLYVLWRIARLYTDNPALQMAVPLLMALQPEFGFACLRFHTHAQLLFFSALSFYYAVTLENRPLLWRPAVALALAIGTKINAIILAPVIVIIMMRYVWQNRRAQFYTLMLSYGALCGVLSIFFYNPLLLVFPFFWNESSYALHVLASCILFSGVNPGDLVDENWKDMLLRGLFHNYAGWWTFPLLAVTALTGIKAIKGASENQRHALWIAGVNAVLMIMLFLFRVKQGPFIYANYVIPVAFVLSFSVLILVHLPRRWQTPIVMATLLLLALDNRAALDEFYFRYQHKLDMPRNQFRLQDYDQLKTLLQPRNGRIGVLTDYRVLVPVSNFTQNAKRDDIFGNMDKFSSDYDYVILSRENPAFWDEEKIRTTLGQPDETLALRALFYRLIDKGLFKEAKFKKIFDNERILVFRKVEKQ